METNSAGGAETAVETDVQSVAEESFDDSGQMSIREQLGFNDETETETPEPEVETETPETETETPEPEVEAEADGDDWTPPTREEWEEMQAKAMLQDGFAEDRLRELLTKADDDADAAPGEGGMDQESINDVLTPREYSYQVPEDIRDKVLIDGDGDAFNTVLREQAQHISEVLEHNYRIDMAKTSINTVKQIMPVMQAVNKFHERHPEMLAMPQLAMDTIEMLRGEYPSANELQLVRFAEKKLNHVLARAKKIIAEQQKAKPKAKNNATPAPVAGGQAPAPRPRQTGAPKDDSVDTGSRLDRMYEISGTY